MRSGSTGEGEIGVSVVGILQTLLGVHVVQFRLRLYMFYSFHPFHPARLADSLSVLPLEHPFQVARGDNGVWV